MKLKGSMFVLSDIKKSILIIVIVLVAVFTCVLLTFRKEYHDDFIVGKNHLQIEAKYGEFDIKMGTPILHTGGYKLKGNLFNRIFSYYIEDLPNYYYIEFNDDGIAYNTYRSGYPGG